MTEGSRLRLNYAKLIHTFIGDDERKHKELEMIFEYRKQIDRLNDSYDHNKDK